MSEHLDGAKASDAVITGIGIVTCQGVGSDAHRALLLSGENPPLRIDTQRFAPYPVHPRPEIDWTEQIPKRGDQRQMDDWQRLGVYTAGLALSDAGLKDDIERCATMDMIVAAGGGERDIAVDTMIADEAANHNQREVLLNQKLTSELRPTLFLAQLSNLMAGNISIVHKVTGSSRTFMGEEGAGISAFETAVARIHAGQSTHALVGGALFAERSDTLFVMNGGQALAEGDWRPLWSRGSQAGGGLTIGSAAAFLILESLAHAEARGARIYATIASVEGDRGARDDRQMEQRLDRLTDIAQGTRDDLLLMSGASGMVDLSAREKAFLEAKFPAAAMRGYSGIVGHSVEAQFPVGIALAAIALEAGALIAPFDTTAEKPMAHVSKAALVTTVGYTRGEGAAFLLAERPKQ
jgi:3-oxoacyl-[acyl-carrier-protein] synthase II